MVKEFKLFWKNYVFQSFLATLTIFISLLFLSMKYAVIIASIGATAFIVFAMPKSITANPKNVIGGHLVGLLSGCLCALIPCSSFLCSIFAYSFAVGLSIFIMVATDTEHPPASGTALGFAITGFDLNAATTLITSIIILSLAHYLFKPYLKNLI